MARHNLKQIACPYCKQRFWHSPTGEGMDMTPLQKRALETATRMRSHETLVNDWLDRLWSAHVDVLISQVEAVSEFSAEHIAALRREIAANMPPRTDQPPTPKPDESERER